MLDIPELKKACLDLMSTADTVLLTTHGLDGYPRTRAMLNMRNARQYPEKVDLFASHREDYMILFSTNTASVKLKQVKANPRACAYYTDPGCYHGVLFVGDIEIIEDTAVKYALWVEGWERYYPQGRDDPDYTVLRLYPKFAEGWWTPQRFSFKLQD